MRSTTWRCVFVALAILYSISPASAKELLIPGVLAASVGDDVVIASPMGGEPIAFATGTVGWLFPAPAGVLYAPDLVSGKTTVIDLARIRHLDTLTGVTMPRFGESTDRYLVVAKDIMFFSYPDRAMVKRVEADIIHPWMVEQSKDQRFVFVLERNPAEPDKCQMVAADMITGQISYRLRLTGDVPSMDLSHELGLMALVDKTNRIFRLVTPARLAPMHVAPAANGVPVSAAFIGDGTWLATLEARKGAPGGTLTITRLKLKKGQLRADVKDVVKLEQSTPTALAVSPDGEFVAVAHDNGEVLIFTRRRTKLVSRTNIGGDPRHMTWCDPLAPGPLLPEWSENENALEELGAR